MDFCRKTILLLIFSSFMSVGWGQNEGDIIITEFFFQSEGNIYEYIELYNTTDLTIDLQGWEIEIDGNEFSIDRLLNINYLDYVVLVSFSGVFQNSTGTTYGSENDSSAFFNNSLSNCDVRRDDI